MEKNYSKRIWEKVKYTIRSPRHRIIPLVVTATASWIGYSLLVRLIKGPEHPINRFQWRLKKARGELTEEQLHKERIVNEYTDSRFIHVADREKPWTGAWYN
ncbi:hypothetical protein L596_029997 [Steinernema carpocapsae]|uniref:Uncharacterized protein n=1 Tax=Steinernema carpocapsae TaxID=34508 RepID=A0A4U5LRF0_STECR|nr:hypothetical protein L596_029997 [Steinernema carpocapsae]